MSAAIPGGHTQKEPPGIAALILGLDRLLHELREPLRFVVEAIDVLLDHCVGDAAEAVELRLERHEDLVLRFDQDEPAELGVGVPAIYVLERELFLERAFDPQVSAIVGEPALLAATGELEDGDGR